MGVPSKPGVGWPGGEPKWEAGGERLLAFVFMYCGEAALALC